MSGELFWGISGYMFGKGMSRGNVLKPFGILYTGNSLVSMQAKCI